ncbi:hypothetical protein O6H91_06G050800 [Diphasiastrum complanatum]|uniref:Uncharacterized protein n=1 Tax=Diphasiastrum complanatum TaxID=34168 RepID=A0ACC2DDY0_DIPCM|nr:hypothetical protein O6H91_06G050800 [Diphasiastrum complanatum]
MELHWRFHGAWRFAPPFGFCLLGSSFGRFLVYLLLAAVSALLFLVSCRFLLFCDHGFLFGVRFYWFSWLFRLLVLPLLVGRGHGGLPAVFLVSSSLVFPPGCGVPSSECFSTGVCFLPFMASDKV